METTVANGERAWAKREQILEGAQRVFLRDGFAAASTDMLAKEAGVSKRTLYAYYPGKEELFVDVVRRLTIENPRTRMLDFVRGLQPRSVQELRTALLTLAGKVLETMMGTEDLALIRAVISDSHRFPQLIETLRLTAPERATVEIAQMLERARANGVALRQGDAMVLTRLFMGPLISYILFDGLLRPISQPQIPTMETLEAIVNLFIQAIIVPGEIVVEPERSPE